MRPKGTAQELERRRQRAVVLVLEHDYSVSAAAEAVGVMRRTVYRWLEAYHLDGRDGIAPQPTPGRPPILDDTDIAKLEKISERSNRGGLSERPLDLP